MKQTGVRFRPCLCLCEKECEDGIEDLKPIIARNIAGLRRDASMTQLELAERLNYSDKAISKWERGESIPDVGVLKAIAELFGVSVDYLLAAEHEAPVQETASRHAEPSPVRRRNRKVISLLSIMLVWLIATFVFVVLGIVRESPARLWLAYVYAIPATAVVALVFNSMWGEPRRNFVIISVLVWSLLLAVYTTCPVGWMWMIFLLGIPAQIIIVLWSRLGKDEENGDEADS